VAHGLDRLNALASRHPALDAFDGSAPIERAATPPSSWYTDPSFAALERDWLKSRWQPLARAAELEAAGDFAAGCWLGEPVVAVRGDDGVARLLRNACLHHGAEVARGTGRTRRLVCPYHGWSYGLDGRLLALPRAQGLVGLSPGSDGLATLPTAWAGPFLFGALSGRAPATPPIPAALEALLGATGWLGLRHVGRRSYRIRCNWKVYVDNYLDGGYHVPALHRDLGGSLDGGSYRTEVHDRWVLQTVRAAGDGDARVGSGAIYAFVHPNFMLNRYGPFLDTNWVVPLDAGHTLVVFDDFVDPEAPELVGPGGDEFLERSLARSETVQREDEDVCESVQRSLASVAYDRGRYAPAVETGLFAFHRWLAADLAADAETGGTP
jgi:choline monooxygenase